MQKNTGQTTVFLSREGNPKQGHGIESDKSVSNSKRQDIIITAISNKVQGNVNIKPVSYEKLLHHIQTVNDSADMNATSCEMKIWSTIMTLI